MGSTWSNHQNMIRKNQEYISEMNRIKMERWIQMHYQIKEREKALQIAKNRELFYWISSFYIFFTINSVARYRRTKRSGVLGPLLPLTFITCYIADLSYGSKLHRIRAEADMILQHEKEILEWPSGIPTVASIDEARVDVEMDHKMHPHQS